MINDYIGGLRQVINLPEAVKKESKEGIISIDEMVKFAKEGMAKSAPQVDLLKHFHQQNPNLNAEQINYIINTVKGEIDHSTYKNSDVAAKLLRLTAAELIHDQVELGEISDKDCLFQSFLEKNKQVSLNSENIATIYEELLPYGLDDAELDRKLIFLDILASSQLKQEEKADYFQKIFLSEANKYAVFIPNVKKIGSKFPLLKIDTQLIGQFTDYLADAKPFILVQTAKDLGIQDRSFLADLLLKSYASGDAYQKREVVATIPMVTGEDSDLAFRLLNGIAEKDPVIAVGGGVINRLGLNDKQKVAIFESALNNAQDRKKGDVMVFFGTLDIDDENLKKAVLRRMADQFPDKFCGAISSMGLNTINYPARLSFVLELTKIPMGRDEQIKLGQHLVSIVLEKPDQNEIYNIASVLMERGKAFEAYALQLLGQLTSENQIKFCTAHDFSQEILPKLKAEPSISNETIQFIREKLSKAVYDAIVEDFSHLGLKVPDNMKNLSENLLGREAFEIEEKISSSDLPILEKALLLTHFAPTYVVHELDNLDENQKTVIAKRLVEAGQLSLILNNFNQFEIKDKKTIHALIDLTLKSSPQNLGKLHPLFRNFNEEERYDLALQLQKKSDIVDHLKALDLNPEHKARILDTESNKPSFYQKIRASYLSEGTIPSKLLSKLIANSIQRDGLETFLSKMESKSALSVSILFKNPISLLDNDDKDAIVKLIAKTDWTLCLSNLSSFKIGQGSTFVDLAKMAKLSEDVAQIVQLAVTGHGAIVAANIKQFTLDDGQKEEIARQIAETNINDLVPFLSDFNLKNKELLTEFAQKASLDPTFRYNVEAFCDHIEAFQLNDWQKLDFLQKAAQSSPETVAAKFNNFKFEDFKSVEKQLFEIALGIYRADPKALEENFTHFGLGDVNRIYRHETERIVALIKEGNWQDLEIIRFKSKTPYLEHLSQLLKGTKTNDIQVIYWTCNFLEEAARQHQLNRNFDKALELRVLTSELDLRLEGSPIEKFEQNQQNPHVVSSINFGVTYNGMDTQLLKGEHFTVRDVLVNNEGKRIVDFKVAYWLADEIRENLSQIDPVNAEKVLNKKVTLLDEYKMYYPLENNNYNTLSPSNIFKGGPIKVIEIQALGRIQIGNSREWGAESNKVEVILNENASLQDLQLALSVLGLTSILLPSTQADQNKLKINTLIHFFYPRFAANRDHTVEYHLQTTEETLNDLEKANPGARKKVLDHLKDVREVEVLPGEKLLYLDNFSDEAEKLGARAAMCGIGFKKDFKSSVEQLANMMGELGPLATEPRFKFLGKIIKGASPEKDFRRNATDSTFWRIVTQRAIDANETISTDHNIGGNIQIFSHTRIFNRMPYFHEHDYYGARNPDDDEGAERYESRPGPEEAIITNERRWNDNNEFMVKNRVTSDHVTVITYQDPRKILMKEIENAIAKNEIDPDFFKDCKSEEDKIAFISDPTLLDQKLAEVKFPDYDPIEKTYKTYHLLNHWTVNPKDLIIKELKNRHCDRDDLIILEANEFSKIKEALETCNSVKERTIELQTQCEKLAGRFVTIQQGYNQSYKPYITAIENEIMKLQGDDFEMFYEKYVTDDVKQKLADLKEQCNKHLISLDFSGLDSLNRELLTSDWNTALHDPDVILALVALDKVEKQDGYQMPLVRYETKGPIYNATGGDEKDQVKILDAIVYGLDQHPVILEKLPLNNGRSVESPLEIMKQYVNRSDVEKSFIPVLQAIKTAYETLYGDYKVTEIVSKFDEGYSTDKWQKQYITLAENILERTEDIAEEKLLYNKAGYSPDQLRKQVLSGLNLLLRAEGIESDTLSKEQLISRISQSIYLLDSKISHLFYDRLHFTAALTSEDTINTEDGPLTIKDLFTGIMESFEKVDESNAIAAEQFYIRLLMISEAMNK